MLTKTCWSYLVIMLLADSVVSAATVRSFDDIAFWTGSGENRAAIVIDWDHASADDASLVWGYRWTGERTGENLLRTVVGADPRLFFNHGAPGLFGLPVYGLGYDLNNDLAFALTDNTSFDELGFAETGIPDSPPQLAAVSTDPNDHYAEGFFTGFWHYAISAGNPFAGGSWHSSVSGLSSRQLADGDWDGWTFEAPPSLMSSAFAANPIAAKATFSADFDSDSDIDGADFLTWQRGFGTFVDAPPTLGDANGDLRVDELDLQVWSATFGNSAPLRLVRVVPEPSTIAHLFATLVIAAKFMFLGASHTPGRRI